MASNLAHKLLKVALRKGSEEKKKLRHETTKSAIDVLCVECILHVFAFLSEEEILCVSNVCGKWKELASQSKIWCDSARKRDEFVKLEDNWAKLVEDLKNKLHTLQVTIIEASAAEHDYKEIKKKAKSHMIKTMEKFQPEEVAKLLLQLTKSYKTIFSPGSTTRRKSYLSHQKIRIEVQYHLKRVQDLANSEDIGHLDDNPFVASLDLKGTVMSTTSEMVEFVQ